MRTSIATVCLSGTLDQKLVAAREAGFDGVEIFEPDLVASPVSPEAIRARAGRLGLSLDLYQPFRDFEGVGPDLLEQNLRRAAAKFTLMNRLGIETMLLCSNVATARSGDEQLAAAQLRELGDLAERFGVRVAYEALAWGRFVDSYEAAARIVRLADHDRIGVCLDSFHILSKGHNPEAIETIPADKIFFVQLADAPLLSMDVLSWSRHHRLFPGEGGFDLGAFMGHLMRTGYDGPISLEIFNDTFRQSDPRATAIDARRSLRWLENEAACWLGASAGGRAARMSASALPAVEPPTDVNYVELRTEAMDDMRALLEQLGFRAHGPHRTKSVELWSQGAARIVLGRPESDRPQPTVAGIGLSVRDPGRRAPARDRALRTARSIARKARATSRSSAYALPTDRRSSSAPRPTPNRRGCANSACRPATAMPTSNASTTSTSRSPGSTSTPECSSSTRCSTCTPSLRWRSPRPWVSSAARCSGVPTASSASHSTWCRRPPTRTRSFPSTSRSRHPMSSRSRDRRAIAASVPSTSRPTTTTTSRRDTTSTPRCSTS